MYNYELYLTQDVNGKSVFSISTDHRMGDLNIWLAELVKDHTITRDVANAVLFVA
jgi:hypothetical protein